MKKANLRYTSVAMSIMAMTTLVVVNDVNAQEVTEEIIVTGTRATIQSSIDQKRISTEIVDGLSADEIGDIPALSIGEALETITGASSHRENGGATEVSIRGLGPFLTNTVINGREATNGAGNRAVNFSIFPSELFNKIGIFKTQSASFIEGAVGGQIRLDTKKPIEHGKRSIQLALKGAYNEEEQDISGGQDIGYRGTISYIDQFETENYGTFGVSIGAQIRDETNPEQEFRTSGTPRVCQIAEGGIANNGNGNCTDGQASLRDPSTENRDFAFLTDSVTYRQNVTSDEREAFFGAVQWQPNEKLDILFDVQLSERDRSEERSDVFISDFNNGLNNENTVISEDGVLQSFQNEGSEGQEVRLNSQNFDQLEEYEGFGLAIEYQVNDDLKISGDISYSNTLRTETELAVQLGDNSERLVTFAATGGIPDITIRDADGSITDLTDPGTFVVTSTPGDFSEDAINGASTATGTTAGVDRASTNLTSRQRFRSQVDIRENTITALRGDFELQTHNLGLIKSIEGGVRFSELEYERRGNVTTDINFSQLNNGIQVLSGVAENCLSLQPEDDFPIDFLSIDVDCSLNEAISAGNDFEDVFAATDNFNGSSVDVEESTFSAYLQANYESELFGFPARGNFGLRAVNTTVDSRTFQTPFLLDFNDSGSGSFELEFPNSGPSDPAFQLALGGQDFLSTTTDSFSYTELLPSATLVLDLSDDVLLRAGIFRGISRSDPAILGSRQQLGTVQRTITDTAGLGSENLTIEDIQNFITTQGQAGGAADLEAFTSWNVDLALEWYPNKDTILSAGVYYKKFKGGYQNTFTDSTFTFIADTSGDSQDVITQNVSGDFSGDPTQSFQVTAPISSIETTDESSNLYGIEVTASHAFTYLPGILGGFGAKLSYNYASSDFEFEDDFAGEGIGLDANGAEVELVGLIPSADIFGLSRNVASAQLYWSGSNFDFQLIGKHRSQYFQQFIDTPGRLRFVDDTNVLEFRASYKLNDNVKFSFEALNITDEERTDFRGVDGNINQVLTFGPRYFFGIKATL